MKLFNILIIIFIFTASNFGQDKDNIVIGKIVKLESTILNEERQIFIPLPNGYDRTSSSYPVLYLLDGGVHFIHASGTVSFLSGNGTTPQIIIVGIPNTDRNRDFTPTKTEGFPNSGGADSFIKFLKEELIPYVDENYRTDPFRILFGHSATAMFSIYTLLSNPDLFNAYIAASPYLMYDNNFVLEFAKKNLPSSYEGNKFLYITLGNEPDYFNIMDEFTNLLRTKSPKGLVWNYSFMENDDHGTVPLKTIYNAFEMIYEGWRLPQDLAKTGNLESVKEHYKNLSEKYEYEIEIPEAILNNLGYQFLQVKRIKEAVEVFKYNVELYSNSVNVYDSLGEGLEADNQFEEAKKNYEIAYLKGKDTNDPNLNFYKQHLDNIQNKLP